MMSPEMMRAAADMMKTMKLEDLAAISRQMQSLPPEQMQRMMGAAGGAPGVPNPAAAADMMRGMKPEDLEFMARQVQSIPPEQMQRMMAQMGGGAGGAAGFPGAANMTGAAQMLQQRQKYELDAATRLKEEGNKLHGAGSYEKAAEKYTRARDNLAAHASSEAAAVRKACSLNLMSCNLKLEKHTEVVALGNEVIARDAHNLKALYRRGQAFFKLRNFQSAVSDLKEAAKLSPEDDTLASVLREAEEELKKQEALTPPPTAPEADNSRGSAGESSVGEREEPQVTAVGGVTIEDVSEEDARESKAEAPEVAQSAARSMPEPSTSAGSPAVDRDSIRSLRMLSSIPPEQVAALSGGSISLEMASMAAKMVSTMSPEELQRMMELASKFGAVPPGAGMPFGVPASAAAAGGGAPVAAPASAAREGQGAAAAAADVPGSGGGDAGAGAFPGAFGQNPMENPEMLKSMGEMMKNLSPEDLAGMSQQMGMPMSVEQAKQTKELLNRVGPENLATMMKYTNKAQGVWLRARQAWTWLLQHPAILVAIVVVIVAVLGRWLGYF